MWQLINSTRPSSLPVNTVSKLNNTCCLLPEKEITAPQSHSLPSPKSQPAFGTVSPAERSACRPTHRGANKSFMHSVVFRGGPPFTREQPHASQVAVLTTFRSVARVFRGLQRPDPRAERGPPHPSPHSRRGPGPVSPRAPPSAAGRLPSRRASALGSRSAAYTRSAAPPTGPAPW